MTPSLTICLPFLLISTETTEQAQARRAAQAEKRRLAAERQAEYEAKTKQRKSSTTSGISPIPMKTKKTMTKAEKRALAAQRMTEAMSPVKAPVVKSTTPKKKAPKAADKDNNQPTKVSKSVTFVKPATPTKVIFKDGQNNVSRMIAKWEKATNHQLEEEEVDQSINAPESSVNDTAVPVVKVHMTALVVGLAIYTGLLYISWSEHQSAWIQFIHDTDFQAIINNMDIPSFEKVTFDEWVAWTKTRALQSAESLKDAWDQLSQEIVFPAVKSIKAKLDV